MTYRLIPASAPPLAPLALLVLAACTETPVAPSRELPAKRFELARAPVRSVTDLGTLGGDISFAFGINNRGQVVGSSQTASGEEHAVLWENGTLTDLGTVGRDPQSVAFGVNELGQVVGYSLTVMGTFHAALWENGSITDLGTLGGTFSEAHNINNRGQVVGTSETATGQHHAALWTLE
jgi:probable HAF family extracellular repeat protein